MKLHYEVKSDLRGPLVILLHGFLGSTRDWDATVSGLADRYRCVAVDLPGHGRSIDTTASYDMMSAATSVIDLVDSLDAASFSIIGYSMGGRLAMYLASIYAMRIDAMVIESSLPGLKTKEERAARVDGDERWAQLLDRGDMGAFLTEWYKQPLFASLAARADLLEHLIAWRSENNARELARALRALSVGVQKPLWDEWAANHIPSLVVTGEHDAKYRAIIDEMARTCATAEKCVVPGAGHNVHEEAPEAYNLAVRAFLDKKIG